MCVCAFKGGWGVMGMGGGMKGEEGMPTGGGGMGGLVLSW